VTDSNRPAARILARAFITAGEDVELGLLYVVVEVEPGGAVFLFPASK